MQRDQLFVTMFLLIAIAAVAGVSLLIYNITQKTAKIGEERTQGFVETSSKLFEIVNVDGNKLYVKNIGAQEIKDLKVYIDGSEAAASFEPIAPNAVGVVVLPKAPEDMVKVVVGEFSQELKLA